jgi:hypothetical protein
MNLQSKAIDESRVRRSNRFVEALYRTKLYTYYLKLRHLIYDISRMLRWNRECLYKVNDYDFSGSLILVEYHLKQVLQSMLNGRHLDEESKDYTKALKLSIRLLYKINNNVHEERAHDKLDATWGDIVLETRPDGSVNLKRELEKTPQDKHLIRQQRIALLETAERRYQRDMKLFWQIFSKYHRHWWD